MVRVEERSPEQVEIAPAAPIRPAIAPPVAPLAELPSAAVAPAPEIEATAPIRPVIQPILRLSEPAQPAAPTAPEISPVPPPQPATELPAADAPPEPTIRVSIGRIDVRVADPPPAKPSPAQRQAPQLSLDEYLRLRSGGKR